MRRGEMREGEENKRKEGEEDGERGLGGKDREGRR